MKTRTHKAAPLFFMMQKGLDKMLHGPLSERIDSIIEKPQAVKQKITKKVKTKQKNLDHSAPQAEDCIEEWEETFLNCPIPTRCPDPWVH
jgi:hypothetical protein